MHRIAIHAEETLRASMHPTLTLRELCTAIAPRVDRTLDPERLRAVLEEYPSAFRVLDPWSGPWRRLARESHDSVAPAWVVSVARALQDPGHAPAARELRETVRWLARSTDPRSRRDVSRWYAIALSERAARRAVVRRAA